VVLRNRPASIRAKLVLAIVASMVALALFTATTARMAGERNVRIVAEQAIAAAGEAFAAAERADVEKLDATLRVLAMNPGIAEAFAARDRSRLLAAVAPVFATLEAEHDATHLYFIEPEPSRATFLRAHKPAHFGDVIHRATLAAAIETKRVAAGKEVGATSFALRVVRPWFGGDGKLVGYVELGQAMDDFLDRMKAQTRDEYALVVEKEFLEERWWAAARLGRRNNWADRERTVVVDSTTPDEGIFEYDGDVVELPARGLLLGEVSHDDRTFARGILPVTDAASRTVGALFVLRDITAMQQSLLAVRRTMYVALAAAAAALGGVLLVLANRLVFARIDRLVDAMDQMSGRLERGDHALRASHASGPDEIGRLEEHFGRFVRTVAGELQERHDHDVSAAAPPADGDAQRPGRTGSGPSA
jgi:HAMP domain-containing protein